MSAHIPSKQKHTCNFTASFQKRSCFQSKTFSSKKKKTTNKPSQFSTASKVKPASIYSAFLFYLLYTWLLLCWIDFSYLKFERALFKNLIFTYCVCMSVLPSCMYVCLVCANGGLWATMWVPPCGCWLWDLGPLLEQMCPQWLRSLSSPARATNTLRKQTLLWLVLQTSLGSFLFSNHSEIYFICESKLKLSSHLMTVSFGHSRF